MSDGLETTFRLLERTRNDAAVRVLLPALDSPNAPIREGALAAILSRRSAAGHREVLRRLDRLDDHCRQIVEARHARMMRAMRDAVLGTDPHLCANGCRAAVWFRQFDLIPALINAAENRSNPNGPLAAKTLLELVELLYGELADPRRQEGRSDPELTRRHVLSALERSLERFSHHRRQQILQAFLLLANRDNLALKRILENPHHAAFLPLVTILSSSPAAGVIGLLLTFLDDPGAPSAALSVVGNRCDPKFVRYLLRKIGHEPSLAVRQNLKRIESVAWLRKGTALLDQLDNAAQHAALRLVMTSGVPRGQAFAAVQHLLLYGKPMGRRAAAKALGEFHGAEANALVVRALEDEDPQVQANVLGQLRHRGILGALPRLLEMVDNPHAVVRQAARASLNEFSFQRFLAAFDMLDEEVRQSVGKLVKKVDPQTIPQLRAEMGSYLRTRRLRALAIAPVIHAVPPLEGMIVRLLQEDDDLVRAEAAKALAQGKLPISWEGLQEALGDPNPIVREAAQKSVRERTRAPRRQEAGHRGPDTQGEAR